MTSLFCITYIIIVFYLFIITFLVVVITLSQHLYVMIMILVELVFYKVRMWELRNYDCKL